jgi:hypothetical protein
MKKTQTCLIPEEPVFTLKSASKHPIPPLTNTLQSYAANTDPTLQNVTPQWTDAVGRSILISSLILDEKPGFLSQLVEQTYPGHNPGGQPDMSPEVIAAAEEVSRAAKDE